MKHIYFLTLFFVVIIACQNSGTKNSVVLNRSKAETLCKEGESYAQKGQLEKAKDLFEESVIADSTYDVPYHNLANVYFSFGDDQTSLYYSEKAIKLDPDFANAYSTKGMTLLRMGKTNESIESHLQAVELDPENCKILINTGIAYFMSDDYTEAYSYYDRALNVANSDYLRSAIYGYIANVNRKENLFDEAIDNYNKAIELEKNNAEAHWNRAVTLQDNLDRSSEACDDLEICIQLGYSTTQAKYRKAKYCN